MSGKRYVVVALHDLTLNATTYGPFLTYTAALAAMQRVEDSSDADSTVQVTELHPGKMAR